MFKLMDKKLIKILTQIKFPYLDLWGTLANSIDPDEMQHNAVFHQGLHCLLQIKQPAGTEIYHTIETSTCDPLNNTMDSPIFIVLKSMENPSEYKRLILASIFYVNLPFYI